MKNDSHLPCPNPKCSSSDGYSVDPKTGWGKCFVCDYKEPPNASHEGRSDISYDTGSKVSERGCKTEKVTPATTVFHEIPHRKISKQAAQKYGIDVVQNHDVIEARYIKENALRELRKIEDILGIESVPYNDERFSK